MELKISGLKVDQGGPGSRGGRIIGHTRSGQPIYASHNHPSHHDFTSDEHGDAARHNRREAQKFSDKAAGTVNEPGIESSQHRKTARHHEIQEGKHEKSAKTAKAEEERKSKLKPGQF